MSRLVKFFRCFDSNFQGLDLEQNCHLPDACLTLKCFNSGDSGYLFRPPVFTGFNFPIQSLEPWHQAGVGDEASGAQTGFRVFNRGLLGNPFGPLRRDQTPPEK